MVCPFLEYRSLPSADASDEPRAYCEAAERFVQPLRADVCNDRYSLAHDRDCEIYREHEDGAGDAESGAVSTSDDETPDGDRR